MKAFVYAGQLARALHVLATARETGPPTCPVWGSLIVACGKACASLIELCVLLWSNKDVGIQQYC